MWSDSWERGADPYLLIGALIEGAVHTLAEHVPAERRRQVTEELGRLLVDRLRAAGTGLIGPMKAAIGVPEGNQ